MEVKTPQQFFGDVLKRRFKPERAKGINVVTHVNLTGQNGGDWTVEIREQKMIVRKGSHSSPNLTIGMTDVDFVDLVNDKLSAQKAFFTGRIKFKGDIGLALKLRDAGFL
jgi:putative sterol carrier protein